MRAIEFTNFNFDAEPYEGWNGEGVIVHAYDGKNEIGHVIFEPTENDNTQWYAVDVEVEEPYQRRGIATKMYDIAKKAAKAAGAIIVKSHTQTDAGRGLWNDKLVWEESNSTNVISAEKLWDYVSKIHPEEQQGGGFLKTLIMLNPEYELKRVPLTSLHIPNDEDEGDDPYGRAMFVDVDHAEEYSQYEVDKKPLVVDSQGYILDGAHRAWAASELLNKKDIMAYVPVKTRTSTPKDLEIRKKFTNQNVTEGQSVKQEIKDFIDSLTPADVGVEEFPGYRIHYEGFTDDCKLSSDYQKNPNKVYQQVYQDFIDREGGEKPVKSSMVGDEEYPILYSVFKVPQSKTIDTAEKAYSIAYKKKRPWPRGSREEKLIRSEWQLSALYDQYVLKQGMTEGKVKLYTDPSHFGAEIDDTGFDSLAIVDIPANQLVGFEPDAKMNQPKGKANVEKIVAGLKQGAKLPPLLVRKYKNGYQVLDGHHRFWAYKLLGVKSIPSRIVPDEDIEEISKQGVTEGSQKINWVKPNFDFEWHEVEEQSRMKQVPDDVRQYYQKHFPNKDAWLKAVQNGKAVVVPPDHAYEIRNAPFDKASLQKVLAPTGHEGPIGPAKEKRVNDLFDKGQVEMPIILKTSQGLWLIGGKTRLGTANYVKGLPAKVWLISGEQDVTEAFNQPYSLQWEEGEFGDYDAYTKLPDGSNLSIMFNKENDDVYTVEFWRNNSQDATGDGDSQKVFATVLGAIQEFLTTKEQPRFISFTGAKGEDDEGKDSRVSLYSKLLQRYATSWGYKLKNVVDRNDAVEFDLVRINQDIEEVVNKEIWHPERMFKQRVPIGDYEFEAIEKTGGMIDWDANALTIIAYDPRRKKGKQKIGNADFVVKGRGSKRSLVSDYTYVDPKYRGEGIATMMYAYAKSLGNDIKGSNIQTPMGKKMWANWGSDAEHLKGTI